MRLVVVDPFHIGETMVQRGDNLTPDQEALVRADPEWLRRCVQVADRPSP